MKAELGPYRKKGDRMVRIRIHNYDMWDLNSTLATIIFACMKRFKTCQKGTPMCMFDDDVMINPSKEDQEIAKKKWDVIIDKITWTMYELSRGEPNSPSFKAKMVTSEKIEQDGSRSFHFVWPGGEEEEKIYDSASEIYRLRLHEGCELLGKYFQHLWT